MNLKVVALAFALGCAVSAQAAADKVIGYFPYWSQYSQFYPKDIRYNTVTHVHENDATNFKDLVKFTKENGVKLVVSVGGAEAEGNLKAIASSEELLPTFVSNIKSWLSANGGDGIELDWQNITAEDAEDYSKLVNALVSDMSGMIVASSMYPYMAQEAYSAETMNKLSYIDVFMPDQMTEESSELVPNQGATKIHEMLSMVSDMGIEKDKLLPVIYLYGKSFVGATGYGSAHQGFGSGNEGYLGYNELMGKFDEPDYKVTFDEESKSELAVSNAEAIVFMGIPSVKAVAEDVKSEGYSGVAVYELDQDHHEPIVSLLVTIGLQLRPEVNYKPKKKK